MKHTRRVAGPKKTLGTVSSRIKNPELVREKHLHIAKKASELFIKKGFDRTTMRDISKATGMALGNLYDYITKKEDLLGLAFDVYQEYVQTGLDYRQVTKIDDPEKMLRLLVRESLQNVQVFKEEIIVMYRESKILPRKDLKRTMKLDMKRIKAIEHVIRQGVEQGVFHVRDPFFAASMIFYQLVFLAFRGWTLQGRYSDKETNDLLEDYIVSHLIA